MDENKYKKIQLDIIGMNCTNCAKSIQTYLEKLEGIKTVQINFTTETAEIIFDKKKISLDTIKESIKKLGYTPIEEEFDAIEEKRYKALKSQKIKITFSIFFSILIIAVSMRDHFGFLKFLNNVNINLLYIFLIILSTIVVFWCGNKFLLGAYNALKNKTSNMDSLVSLGTLSSYIYSLVISFNHIFNLKISLFENSHEVYFETSSMIITFILIGNYLEAKLKAKTYTSINKLKGLRSKFVNVIRNGNEIQIPYRKVKVNDIVIVKTGEKVPVDGYIIEGQCIVDESTVTGESLQYEKIEGDYLISGTIIINGAVKLSAEKVGEETTLSKIINLVKEASLSKPKIQRLADKISAVFVPLVILISIFTFIIWNFVIGEAFDKSLLYAVSVLIIACPCALGLASPMAVVIGIGRAAENGVLFNNIEAIEKLNKVNTICFDKTGTLTTGKMKIKTIKTSNGLSTNEILKYAYSLEKYSNHPIAKSINYYCYNKNIIPYSEVENVVNHHGMGITGLVNKKPVLIGNSRMLKNYNISTPKDYDETNKLLYICIENKVVAAIEFSDTEKKGNQEIISKLKQRNIELFLISGDEESATKEVASSLDIKNYIYKALPEDKEQIISKLQQEGKYVAMVGDGINDTPSLARANVSIAVGTATDIVVDSSDIVLLKGEIRNIIKALNISKHTVRIIKQNIFWAFFYNIIAIPLAAGILSPYGIIISPVMASMLMAFSDVVTVMGNSLRLKVVRID
ncbi:MAG: heavy metal translocating P-type ATPase [Ignavibacteria bacterium]|nr:heavy metal translocating P-type ATPase [Ignavibacteria bacterium]